ncbi:MAG: hypothetical protein R3F46_04510 [bacterium]
MRPSWERKYDQQETEFQQRQAVIGEIESRNNLNGGISRHLGLGDGRPGIEWTGLEVEYDSAISPRWDFPPLFYIVAAVLAVIAIAAIYMKGDPALVGNTAGQPPPAAGQQQTTPPGP